MRTVRRLLVDEPDVRKRKRDRREKEEKKGHPTFRGGKVDVPQEGGTGVEPATSSLGKGTTPQRKGIKTLYTSASSADPGRLQACARGFPRLRDNADIPQLPAILRPFCG
jgi:hypothetical protein